MDGGLALLDCTLKLRNGGPLKGNLLHHSSWQRQQARRGLVFQDLAAVCDCREDKVVLGLVERFHAEER